jgi:HlyD family secretion protein
MQRKWTRRIVAFLLAAFLAAGLIWFAWPAPIPVDLAAAAKGPMEVTVDDEGKTRVREIYTVSAPLSGKLLRISAEPGDEVGEGEILAVLQPAAPAFQDIRTRKELEAMLEAANAAVIQAEHEMHRLQAALDFSQAELKRALSLRRGDAIAAKSVDQAKFDVETYEAALASAKAQLEVRRKEQATAAARLTNPTSSSPPDSDPPCCFEVRAPTTGRILKILQESEAVVQAGMPLVEIGNPTDLEIVVDLLSTDAVQVQTGFPARIDGWGGPPLNGRVTRVDPAGFVKISALGIEEQRVRTRIELIDPPEKWSRLGHDYRVIVHIIVWNGSDVLTIPVSSLFRTGDDWSVFSVKNGRAWTSKIEIGHRNNRIAEVLSGLKEGDRVILHPSDRISSKVPVSERESSSP